ncbi:hypothetical protein M3J09_013028 [Ascochyta lentis]
MYCYPTSATPRASPVENRHRYCVYNVEAFTVVVPDFRSERDRRPGTSIAFDVLECTPAGTIPHGELPR